MPRAGLTPATVTQAAAELLDEVGPDGLSMGLLAERLGVRAPSLYKHVDSVADLAHRVAVQATGEIGDELREATQGKAERDALLAAATVMRKYFIEHPGRAAVASSARSAGPDDALSAARARVLASYSAILGGYHLEPEEEVHAVRLLRSVLLGFTALEANDGFQFATGVGDSFDWIVDLIDRGLQAAAEQRDTSRESGGRAHAST